MKKNLLLIITLLFSGIFVSAQTQLYHNDFDTAPTVTGSAQFTYGAAAGHWTITGAGHDEWETFTITFPTELNFQTAGNFPIVRFRAKSTENLLFTIVLVDYQGRVTDEVAVTGANANRFEIAGDGSYFDGTIDFTGFFDDNYGNGGLPQGPVDSTRIASIRFGINLGWASFPTTGALQTYNNSFGNGGSSTLSVDQLRIGGTPLNINAATVVSSSKLFPNPSNDQTFMEFNLAEASDVKVIVTDVMGKQIDVVLDNNMNAGAHAAQFNVSDYSKGIYYVNYFINNEPAKMQMLLVK